MWVKIINILILPFASCTLSPTYNSTLLQLVALKNTKPRYDLELEEIPSRFAPEDPSYSQGLITEAWWAILLSLATSLTLFAILYTRFRYGYFGGKKLKNTEFTAYVRWAPGFVLTLSFLLFFISSISLLLESSKITEKAESLGKNTLKHSQNMLTEIESTHQYLVSLNMEHVSDDLHINVENLDLTLEEGKIAVKTSRNFKRDVNQINNRRVIVTFVVFCLGIIFYIIGALGFYLKIESIGYFLAISMGVLAALDYLAVIPYVMERVASTDFCEQIIECTTENSLPVSGHEIGFYFSDFSQNTKEKLALAIKDLEIQLEISDAEQGKFIGSNGKKIGAIRIEEIIWKDTSIILEHAIMQLQKLKTSFYIKSLCNEINNEICGEVFSSFMLSEFTVIIFSISFILASFSGFLAPRVFERWRLEEEQNALAKHNLYNVKKA